MMLVLKGECSASDCELLKFSNCIKAHGDTLDSQSLKDIQGEIDKFSQLCSLGCQENFRSMLDRLCNEYRLMGVEIIPNGWYSTFQLATYVVNNLCDSLSRDIEGYVPDLGEVERWLLHLPVNRVGTKLNNNIQNNDIVMDMAIMQRNHPPEPSYLFFAYDSGWASQVQCEKSFEENCGKTGSKLLQDAISSGKTVFCFQMNGKKDDVKFRYPTVFDAGAENYFNNSFQPGGKTIFGQNEGVLSPTPRYREVDEIWIRYG